MVHIGNDWDDILREEFSSDNYQSLRIFLKQEYSTRRIYPPMGDIYNALRYTSRADARVVILGQDPYHGEGQAHGLCFSVREEIPFPPSLNNIFKELTAEYGMPPPPSGELTGWAKQGVLLLNTTLTVREHQPQSHVGHGWEWLTDAIIDKMNQKNTPVVFLLWGANARSKAARITSERHLVLTCAHPSPLSAFHGFFGCDHFKKANAFLLQTGQEPIDWTKTKA